MKEKMVDAIKNGNIVTISEREAREEDLFILRINESHLSDYSTNVNKSKLNYPTIGLTKPDYTHKPQEKWRNIAVPQYKKNNVIMELIDNFHWEIGKARKRMNLSRLQLANVLGVPEIHIKMIENGELPADDFVLISKIQNYLGINLRKDGKKFEFPQTPVTNVHTKQFYPDNISLADLQKMKETNKKRDYQKLKKDDSKIQSLFGNDIELIY